MIEVEDAPFLAVEVERVTSNENESFGTNFSFRTNLDEFVICGPENPLRVNIDPKTQEPNPYILVRDGPISDKNIRVGFLCFRININPEWIFRSAYNKFV